mgnify:CR=1 FL=1
MNLFHEAKKVLDKDGKVNPLGPYGKQKLTGREVSTYFRRNKVKDPQIKKAVEVALDLQGAMSVASSEIKKFYGDKILKSKEVQKALQYANESVEHDIREDLNEAMKLKDIVRKHKSVLMKAKKSGNLELPQKVEDELSNWANNNGDIHGDDPDEFSDWLDNNLDDLVPTLKIRESVNENYRKLAVKGMGTETPRTAKVGMEIDYYSLKDGSKRMGKIVKATPTVGYQVKDDKDGKIHTFLYHDRVKAKKLMKASNEFDKNPLKGFPYNEELQKKESINEVTDKEINMAKKLSKDMEKVKKGYQQIAKSGDKTLKSVGFNPTYEAILKAQQKVLSLIGELNTMKMMSDRAASRQKDSKGRPIMNSFDAYRDMQNAEHCELIEGKVLKFTKVKDKSLEKHLKVVTKKVGAKLEKISGGFQVSDTDMRGFTAVVDYIFDKSIKKNMLDGGGMSDVNMVSESLGNQSLAINPKTVKQSKPMLMKHAKKFGVDLEFGMGGKLPSVLQMKGSSGAVKNFIASIQKDKKLMSVIENHKLNVMDEYAKMYEDAVQKAREKMRMSQQHKREKEALAKKHANMPNK